jgi:hypothetical protein
MVGTSATRSPAVRQDVTARRNVATVRMTSNRWANRWAMRGFVWLRDGHGSAEIIAFSGEGNRFAEKGPAE